MIATSYLLYIRDHHCENCSHGWSHSEMYRIDIRGDDRRVTLYCGEPEAGAEIGITTLQPRRVPTCYRCIQQYKYNHNQKIATAGERWAETLRRKEAEEQDARTAMFDGFRRPAAKISREAARRAAEPSLDDL